MAANGGVFFGGGGDIKNQRMGKGFGGNIKIGEWGTWCWVIILER